MPNWCSNTIVLKGKAKDLKRFDDQFKAPVEKYYGGAASIDSKDDMILSELGKGWKGWIEYRIREKVNSNGKGFELNYISGIDNKAGYSFSNFVHMTKDDFLNGWYDWSVKNWGTKWDCCSEDVSVTGLEEAEEAIEQNMPDKELYLTYYFDTAWSPCCPVVAEMARQYPGLEIQHYYVEEGCLIAGVDEYKDGEIVSSKEADPDNFREFIENFQDTEFYKCENCGKNYMYEWELEGAGEECPECGSKEIVEM